MNTETGQLFLVVVIVTLGVSFAYSIFITGTPLLWMAIVFLIIIVLLVWKLVETLDRIASALEE